MRITKVLETQKGPYTIDMEVNEEEYNFIVEVGLATLLSQGALPFIRPNDVLEGKLTGEIGHT